MLILIGQIAAVILLPLLIAVLIDLAECINGDVQGFVILCCLILLLTCGYCVAMAQFFLSCLLPYSAAWMIAGIGLATILFLLLAINRRRCLHRKQMKKYLMEY